MEVTYRCLIAPDGKVRPVVGGREHYEEAEEVLRERGLHAEGYDASRALDKEGWIRVSPYSVTRCDFATDLTHLTQAQRDSLFDLAMAAQADGWTSTAQTWVHEMNRIAD
jgi:hypothetical protein